MTDSEPPIVLAVDIGTSSVKAGLYDSSASSIPGVRVSVAHEQTVKNDGTVEEPVERIVEAVESAIDQVLGLAGERSMSVDAVAMDSMASTVLGVDVNGEPVTPVYTYADTRSAQDVDQLRKELDVAAVHQRTGAMQHTSYVPGRVRWLQRTDRELSGQIKRWLDISTYLHSRWFGTQDVAASYSIASWSGLLNRHTLEWDAELLDHLSLSPANLPELVPHSEPKAGLCGEFRSRWPMLSDVPFFLAVGDGAAVNVGTGCTGPDRIALSVGTTSAMRVLTRSEAPEVPDGLWAYRLGVDATLMGGAFSEGGLLVEWAQQTLRLPPLEHLDTELASCEPDSHGLTILPFLAGERATGWSTNATGVFEGVRTSTSALEIVQGMMEAVSLRFALVAELLLPVRPPDLVFVASGGAIRSSKWWLQTMADALDATVVVNAEEQGTSKGAALLALQALGAIDSVYELQPEVAAEYRPRAAASAVLKKAALRQQNLYSRSLG